MSHFPLPAAPRPVLLSEAQAACSRQYGSAALMLEEAEKLSSSRMPDHRQIALLISTARAIMDGAVAPGEEELTDRELADKLDMVVGDLAGMPRRQGYVARAAKRLREVAGPVVTPAPYPGSSKASAPDTSPVLPCTCFGPVHGDHSADCPRA